jgi:hypothetical protein
LPFSNGGTAWWWWVDGWMGRMLSGKVDGKRTLFVVGVSFFLLCMQLDEFYFVVYENSERNFVCIIVFLVVLCS